MIKISRKTTEKSQRAADSLQNAKKCNRSYNTPEVNAALKELFHGKCYICENKQITSYNIEHLIRHHENPDLKYDWNNLFLACAHCNNTKLGRYEPILDCTKKHVDKLIAFRKQGYFGTEERLTFDALDSRIETQNTISLLQEVYYGSTPQKKMESLIIRRSLRKELSQFKEYVREYQEAEDEEKEDLKCLLKQQLGEASPFTAFKRWLIRDHEDTYPELSTYIPQEE
ncbi:MAG: hypothetical protein HFI66_00470 [Lachnospiraceae bacterium]|jgi:uncharacterized protein (TIGR02646 family)|nr:hypothetical protein [Lachnospiraceae bacterium]